MSNLAFGSSDLELCQFSFWVSRVKHFFFHFIDERSLIIKFLQFQNTFFNAQGVKNYFLERKTSNCGFSGAIAKIGKPSRKYMTWAAESTI